MPPKEFMQASKIIWCFGNPMDIVVSCQGDGAHCANLGGDYEHMNEIYDRDVMGLEKHFDAWYRKQPAPGDDASVHFATVKYEKIFSHISDIKDFMGVKMDFPDFRPRKTNWKKHWAAPWLKETYGRLAEKVNDAEGFKAW